MGRRWGRVGGHTECHSLLPLVKTTLLSVFYHNVLLQSAFVQLLSPRFYIKWFFKKLLYNYSPLCFTSCGYSKCLAQDIVDLTQNATQWLLLTFYRICFALIRTRQMFREQCCSLMRELQRTLLHTIVLAFTELFTFLHILCRI